MASLVGVDLAPVRRLYCVCVGLTPSVFLHWFHCAAIDHCCAVLCFRVPGPMTLLFLGVCLLLFVYLTYYPTFSVNKRLLRTWPMSRSTDKDVGRIFQSEVDDVSSNFCCWSVSFRSMQAVLSAFPGSC